jgi:copper chaperone NosL
MTARTTSRMSRLARALTAVAALLLAALYVTPLWSVRLVAPQYPEGLGMNIHLSSIVGVKEFDLRNINALNHYIGMKPIDASAIPELQFMPWIVAGLIGTGLLVAVLGRRRGLLAWTAAFALVGAAGLFDFWRWSYDYGHNLDTEHAIIVVPGMTYQPPIIGTKQLLNFTATSYPATGGILAGVAMLLAGAALVLSYRRRAIRPSALAFAAATACATGPAALRFGIDACLECRMMLSDKRFGAAIVTKAGKTLPFDSVDCMIEYLARMNAADVESLWVVNSAAADGSLIAAEQALFVHDGSMRPPMGSLVAFAREDDAQSDKGATGTTLSWSAVREFTPAGAAHAR